jgi:hypothetical protein
MLATSFLKGHKSDKRITSNITRESDTKENA